MQDWRGAGSSFTGAPDGDKRRGQRAAKRRASAIITIGDEHKEFSSELSGLLLENRPNWVATSERAQQSNAQGKVLLLHETDFQQTKQLTTHKHQRLNGETKPKIQMAVVDYLRPVVPARGSGIGIGFNGMPLPGPHLGLMSVEATE